MNPLIKTEKLSVIYNVGKPFEFPALLGIDMEIFEGEYIIFFGPSGCGKSTLLNCIAGLETPTKGKVFFKNEEITKYSNKRLVSHRRHNIGMIFQNYNLIPTLNILDNTILPHTLGGHDSNIAKKKANNLLEEFGIPNLKRRYPSELSGGQRQRAAIARSLMYDPPIILADEPVGNLDSESARIVMDFLEKFNIEKKETIILVTHDPNYLKFAHRVFHMKDGKIIRKTVNHNKKQIFKEIKDKEISSESEYLKLVQEYPHLTEVEIKSKMVLDYILNNYEIETRKKIEKIIADYLLGKIDKKTMKELFDLPTEKGGINLYKQTARRMTEKIFEISSQIKLVEKIKNGFYVSSTRERVIDISSQIIKDYSGSLSLSQIERLENAIADRIISKIEKKEFLYILDEPFNRGGVGLNRRTAIEFARKIEIIIGK